MIIKAAPSHRFIACQQGKKILCAFIEEQLRRQQIEFPQEGKNDREFFDTNDDMTTDKIKHFYVTVSVAISCFLLLLIFYGCYTYRQRRLESETKRILLEERRKSRGNMRNNSNASSQQDRHMQQKLMNNNLR